MNLILLKKKSQAVLYQLSALLFFSFFLVSEQSFAATPQYELDARNTYENSTINADGIILQANGHALSGATVFLQGQTTTTDSLGQYLFTGLQRNNSFLEVSCAGYQKEIVPIALRIALIVAEVTIPPFSLIADDANNIRFLFGGDTSFARRFLDPPEVTPPNEIPADNPDALILASDPEPGSREVVQYIRPYYQNVDFGVLNFESPVTDDPSTPHLTKSYKYFSLIESLPALTWLGVDYVSLGNNHVYDYLATGMADTLTHINNFGIMHSGAGMNANEAYTAHRMQHGDTKYSFLSMTSVTGNQHPVSYVADATKGGAADLTDNDAVLAALQREVDAGYLPIVQLHGGKEYTYSPSDYVQGRFQLAAENAALIIAHHPHVAQGVGMVNDVITVHCLGNLAFDQDRLDTMLGLLAQVDMRGEDVERIRLLPVTIKDYRPRPLSGEQALHFLRRIAEYSTGFGLQVFPYAGQIFVERNAQDVSIIERQLTLPVTIPASGSLVLDLRQLKEANESMHLIHSNNNTITAKLGRDILIYGDFENHAVDDAGFDAPRWDISGTSSFVSVSNAMKGVAGMSSVRSFENTQDSIIPFRNRIRVAGDTLHAPLKELSFFGYLKGDNAGLTTLKVVYHASFGDNTFGEESFTLTEGSHNWEPKELVLNMPAEDPAYPNDLENNARAVRLYLRQNPPEAGDATVSFDELALINWEVTTTLPMADTLAAVNQYDFVKVSGDPGTYDLSFNFRTFMPKIVNDPVEPESFPWLLFLAPITSQY